MKKTFGPLQADLRGGQGKSQTIYNHNTIGAIFAEVHREGLAQSISIRAYDQGFQSLVQCINHMKKCA